jgi:hypothetical protein
LISMPRHACFCKLHTWQWVRVAASLAEAQLLPASHKHISLDVDHANPAVKKVRARHIKGGGGQAAYARHRSKEGLWRQPWQQEPAAVQVGQQTRSGLLPHLFRW